MRNAGPHLDIDTNRTYPLGCGFAAFRQFRIIQPLLVISSLNQVTLIHDSKDPYASAVMNVKYS